MDKQVDAVVVGAGFGGLYMLHKLREIGLTAQCFEAGDGVGGTWYWNRYPGARCDVESMDYTYSWSEELQQEWRWTERYPSQPEILRYVNHVADRFELRQFIQFETHVTEAVFDQATGRWTVRTERGDVVDAQYCVMATGCLSAPRMPDFAGVDSFEGETYHTGQWPHEGVDFTGKRVGIIGTGSSAIQSIPQIAEQAEHLYVFQRTPNFSIPAHNRPLDKEREHWIRENFAEFREAARLSGFGGSNAFNMGSALDDPPEKRLEMLEERWKIGGIAFLGTYGDFLFNQESNDIAAEFVRQKIRSIVKDPGVAELLAPKDHPLGTKRICVDIGYYETYNRDNVTLVDVRSAPIAEITPNGLRTEKEAFELDAIVFATGFDAMTGTLLRIDIRGREGLTLQEKWAERPRTYLGLMIAGFPNLFTITGPQSPSVLSNMILSIEQHVEWIGDLFVHLRDAGSTVVDATEVAEKEWGEHVEQIAALTLFPKANSWYLGANIPGKPRAFMPYIGGVALYRAKCEEVAANGYEGFMLTPGPLVTA